MDQSDSDEKLPVQSLPLQHSVPINFIVPDSIQTQHATNVVIQQRGTEFTLLFFELRPPLFTGTMEEQVEEYRKLQSVDGVCVARIVMGIENMQELLQNVVTSVNQLRQAQKGMKE